MSEVSSPPDPPEHFHEDWLEEEPEDPLFEELSKLMSSPRVGRETAEQMAQALATSGQSEANVAPDQRLLFDDLFALTQRVVATETGLTANAEVAVVGRGAWARQTVRDWRRYTEELVKALKGDHSEEGGGSMGLPASPESDFLLDRLMESLIPTMAALWTGTAVGRLARGSLGSYDVPVPRGKASKPMLAAPNIRRMAKVWNLTLEDTGLWVGLYSNTMAGLMEIHHVAEHLSDLICEYMRSCLRFRLDDAARSIGEGLHDPKEIRQIFSIPDSLLGIDEEAGGQAKKNLESFIGVLVGYADFMTERMGRQMLGGQNPIYEAFRRRRLHPPSEYGSVARLFGVDVSASGISRGAAFVNGVVERADIEGLARLWKPSENLPTLPEMEAPGLWLARIDLPA